MELIRTEKVKSYTHTVKVNGDEYTRFEKYNLIMGDYIIERIEWRDMFNRLIATYRNNKIVPGNPWKNVKERVIKFKQLEREFKIMKSLQITSCE